MTDPSTLLEMDLPDEVIKKAIEAYWDTPAGNNPFRDDGLRPAIRAALQALVDCGRARKAAACEFNLGKQWEASTTRAISGSERFPALILRLSPQRKEKEP